MLSGADGELRSLRTSRAERRACEGGNLLRGTHKEQTRTWT
jgi:hypothetical protein